MMATKIMMMVMMMKLQPSVILIAHLSANSASDVNTTFLPLHLWNTDFIFCIEKFNTEEFQIVEILFPTLLSFNATGPQSFTMVGRHT